MQLGHLVTWRHGLVGSAVLGSSLLAYNGVIGETKYPERFDAKLVVVSPAAADGLRIDEYIDQDFGTVERRGYQRVIPHDFGEPIDIEADSPDAPDNLNTTTFSSSTRIRIGDPDQTIIGQHRYTLSYTLPAAQISTDQLALNIIGFRESNEEKLETVRVEVIVTGFQLDDPTCNVGAPGTVGGCDLIATDDGYRAIISPLRPGEGITIGGTITARTDPVQIDPPPLPPRRNVNRLPLTLGMLPLGTAAGYGVYRWARTRGSNEVYSGGAADAAFGSPGGATTQVPDDEIDDLATIEFTPPKGIEPWQAAVLISERIDDSTVSAWLSGVIAKEGLTITPGDDPVLSAGQHRDRLSPGEATRVDQLLDGKQSLQLGTYSASFNTAWSDIRDDIERSVAQMGWWSRLGPSKGQGGPKVGVVVLAFALFAFGAGSLITALLGAFSGPALGIVFGIAVPAVTAYFAYRVLLPARSAHGSAMALKAESFRRFLAASEGKHVDWAWKHGLLREYSAWAVALGAAGAWQAALEASHVPPAEVTGLGPVFVPSYSSAINSTRTAPTSSGGSSGGGWSGGGGGFSGGSTGGGGGGGSSGSW
jgi:uncharacterized membrane protein YgcG